jgi:hypothetical protein
MKNAPGESTAPDDRADFIKRLFAVAISVGFATQVTRLISAPSYQNAGQLQYDRLWADNWRSIVLLLVAVWAVIESWEGYLRSIARRKLDGTRFKLDVLITFLYLLLMLSSAWFGLWAICLSFIFAAYLLWDYLARRVPLQPEHHEFDNYYEQSEVITLWWAAPIFLLAATVPRSRGDDASFMASTFAAFCAITLYRLDKSARWRWQDKILGLLVVVGLVAAGVFI